MLFSVQPRCSEVGDVHFVQDFSGCKYRDEHFYDLSTLELKQK